VESTNIAHIKDVTILFKNILLVPDCTMRQKCLRVGKVPTSVSQVYVFMVFNTLQSGVHMAVLTNTDYMEVVFKAFKSILYKLVKVHIKQVLMHSKTVIKKLKHMKLISNFRFFSLLFLSLKHLPKMNNFLLILNT
jgi:hypothetical protein